MSKSRPSLSINEYDYPLPEERIAAFPLPRGESKLLIYHAGELAQSQYKFIDEHLPSDAWLVLNKTRVVQARLLFPKNEQTLIEVFCLEPIKGMSVEQAMQQTESITYQCLVGGARKWKQNPLEIKTADFTLRAEKLERIGGNFEVRLSWNTKHTFGEILELAGKTPLPPYIKRAAEESDRTTYQTVYASQPGSVAAPTAGLHFNQEIFHKLENKGMPHSYLTLHVGAGTFKPVSAENVAEHEMHAEEIHLETAFIEDLVAKLKRKRKIFTVGTTSLRALESLYWLAVLLKSDKADFEGEVTIPQWVGFDNDLEETEPVAVFEYLLTELKKKGLNHFGFKTQLIIAPGYRHKIISGLITNFHQPKSTLLLLIASLMGDDWRKAYDYALAKDFRFLSYGDGCLIFNEDA